VIGHADDTESLVQSTIGIAQDEVAQAVNIEILATLDVPQSITQTISEESNADL
jgi:hypothetical protein